MNPTTTLTNNNPPATHECGLNPSPICREESETPHTWSGHTQGFLPNTRITYVWTIYRNGVRWFSNEHGGYYTDGTGYHWRLPSGFPQAIDCDAGHYQIYMYVRSDANTYQTWTGHAETVCT